MSASESLSNKLVREQLTSHTETQSAAQASTNSYAGVSESVLNARGKNAVQYVVKNSGANTITAKIQGRIVNADGDASDWIDSTLAAADVTAGAAVGFALTANPFSETRIAIVAKVADSQGAALVHGQASKI